MQTQLTDSQVLELFEIAKLELSRIGWSIVPMTITPSSFSNPISRNFSVQDSYGQHVFSATSLSEIRNIIRGLRLAQDRWFDKGGVAADPIYFRSHSPEDTVSAAYKIDVAHIIKFTTEQAAREAARKAADCTEGIKQDSCEIKRSSYSKDEKVACGLPEDRSNLTKQDARG